MKTIFILFLFLLSLHAYTVNCKNTLVASSLYNYSSFSLIQGSYGAELNDGELYFEFDTYNYQFLYWDNTSPLCGGDSLVNTLVHSICSFSDDSCGYDPKEGTGSNAIVNKNDDGDWTNPFIVIDGYSCLPLGLSNITIGFYNTDTHADFGLFNSSISRIDSKDNEYVSQSVADEQKAICSSSEEPNPEGTDYSGQLDQLIENTSKNKSQDERAETLSNNLDSHVNSLDTSFNIDSDLSSFETTFETTLEDSFTAYADVFGFSSYEVAPKVISFEMFGNTYEVFNITTIDPYIDNIRLMFLTFAYLWGFIIVFKTI